MDRGYIHAARLYRIAVGRLLRRADAQEYAVPAASLLPAGRQRVPDCGPIRLSSSPESILLSTIPGLRDESDTSIKSTVVVWFF